MPNKCSIVKCKGNYNKNNRCRVFRLPKDRHERQKWLDVLPLLDNFDPYSNKFFVCEKHWCANPPTVTLPGGFTRPAIPPSLFNVPASILPSLKPAPCLVKAEDEELTQKDILLQKDKITSFDAFKPECDLQKQYKNIIISRSEERFVCLFMTENFSECKVCVIVENKPTLCCPLTCRAFKKDFSVPLRKTLHPTGGLRLYSQFFKAVKLAVDYDIPFDNILENVVTLLKSHTSGCVNSEKEKKLVFLTHQLELLSHKRFSMNDNFLALELYPKCSYEQLKEYLVLPGKRTVQYLASSIEKDQEIKEDLLHHIEGDSYENEFIEAAETMQQTSEVIPREIKEEVLDDINVESYENEFIEVPVTMQQTFQVLSKEIKEEVLDHSGIDVDSFGNEFI